MGYRLKGLIEKKKDQLIKNWFEATLQTYAPDTAQFYKGRKDQFANPVGHITSQGISFLLDQLLNDFDPDAIRSHLDPIIRIRAIQNFSPSQATAFIFLLKNVLRNHLSEELRDAATMMELLAFESKIDQLSLIAFDIYMTCKEKIYQIAANETRQQTLKAFERAGLVAQTPQRPQKVKGANH
jgi:ribosomal protein S15P/S13E